MIFALGELALLALLAGLAVLAPALPVKLWLLLAVLLALSLAGFRRAFFLLGLLLLTGSLGSEPLFEPTGLWLILPAVLLLVLGQAAALRARETFRSRERADWQWAGAVTLAACAFTALAARAVLLFRSTMDLWPGRVDFLWAMLLWAGIGYGLDAHLRFAPGTQRGGAAGWLWQRRHSLALAASGAVILARSGFS